MLKCIKSDYFHDFDDFEDKQGKEKKKEKEKKKRKEKKKKEKKKEKRNELGGKEFDSKPNLNQRAALLPSESAQRTTTHPPRKMLFFL